MGLVASEAAFWPDLEAQIASLFQIVPDVDGSEAIIESTANGYNDFHKLWRLAESGASEWLPIFLPWSLDPEYRKKPDEDFTITAEEIELKKLYGLEDAQIAWRRAKARRTIHGVTSAGLRVGRIEVAPDGRVVITPKSEGVTDARPTDDTNEWDA